MSNNEPISFDDWLAIADFYYHDKPPIRNRDARVVYLDKEEPTKKEDNPHYNKPIMELF